MTAPGSRRRAFWKRSRPASARSPSATSAPTRASTRPTDRPRRRRPHLGGPLHDARRPRRKGATSREPDVVIGTDADTWLALRRGELSGIEAFASARSTRAATSTSPSASRACSASRTAARRCCASTRSGCRAGAISTLTMGEGPDVLLIHGLGGAKSSFFDTAAALSRRYRVHALDLPGFGSSSKPATAPYTARWFAETVLETWTRSASSARTSSATRWAAASRSRSACAHPERVARARPAVPGRRVRQARVPPDRAAPAPRARRCCRTASRAAWSRSSSGRCSPTPTRSTRASPTSSSTSSSASTPAPARASPSSPRAPQHLPRRALRPRRLLPAAARARAAGAVRLGHARHADPAGLQAPRRAAGCRAPSRSCSTAAATCRRSSAPSRPPATARALLRARRRRSAPRAASRRKRAA